MHQKISKFQIFQSLNENKINYSLTFDTRWSLGKFLHWCQTNLSQVKLFRSSKIFVFAQLPIKKCLYAFPFCKIPAQSFKQQLLDYASLNFLNQQWLNEKLWTSLHFQRKCCWIFSRSIWVDSRKLTKSLQSITDRNKIKVLRHSRLKSIETQSKNQNTSAWSLHEKHKQQKKHIQQHAGIFSHKFWIEQLLFWQKKTCSMAKKVLAFNVLYKKNNVKIFQTQPQNFWKNRIVSVIPI